jgi:hypothetical protein
MNHIPIDENPMVKEYETVTDEGGFLVSRRTENNYIAEGENG